MPPGFHKPCPSDCADPPATSAVPGGIHGTRLTPATKFVSHSSKPGTTAQPTGISPELAAYFKQGVRGFQSPTTDLDTTCDHHIMPVNASVIGSVGTGLAAGLIHPLLMSVQGPTPSLTNKYQGGWASFAREWENHMHVVYAYHGGQQPHDKLLLRYLKSCLDTTDQLLLDNMEERNPYLSFQSFWDHLASLYDRDSQSQHRLAWESVRLPSGDLSLERWLTFVREFHLQRDRVEERTPQEEYKLILKQLPPDWQAKIIMEEAKRARGKFLVRMTNLPTIHPTALKELLETAINTTVDRVTPAAQGFYIQCPDAPTQSKVMGLAGNAFDNYIVKCSRVDPSLNADQLVDFVTERLQTQHRLAWDSVRLPSGDLSLNGGSPLCVSST